MIKDWIAIVLLCIIAVELGFLANDYFYPFIDNYVLKEKIFLPTDSKIPWNLYVIEDWRDMPDGKCKHLKIRGCTVHIDRSIVLIDKIYMSKDTFGMTILTHELLHASCGCNFHGDDKKIDEVLAAENPWQFVMNNRMYWIG